jgi:hypothetical protein
MGCSAALGAKHQWRGEARATLGGRTWWDWRRRGLGLASMGWTRGLPGWARTSVSGEREGTEDGRCESKRKVYSGEYAKGWADCAGEGRWPVKEVGQHDEKGWEREANGRLDQKGRMTGWLIRKKNRKVLIFEFT